MEVRDGARRIATLVVAYDGLPSVVVPDVGVANVAIPCTPVGRVLAHTLHTGEKSARSHTAGRGAVQHARRPQRTLVVIAQVVVSVIVEAVVPGADGCPEGSVPGLTPLHSFRQALDYPDVGAAAIITITWDAHIPAVDVQGTDLGIGKGITARYNLREEKSMGLVALEPEGLRVE